MKFELNGQSIEISDGKCNFWCLQQEFSSYTKEAQEEFLKSYKSTENLENLIDKFWNLVDLLEMKGYIAVSCVLEDYGRIHLTQDEYESLFGDSLDTLTDWFEKYYFEIANKYTELTGNKLAKKEYRKNRKANRKKWYGYTTEAKTKAAMRNMGSGMLHSTVNIAGNVTTAIATDIKMSSAFNDKRRINNMSADINKFFNELRKVVFSVMEKSSYEPFELISKAESEEAAKKIAELQKIEEKSDEHIRCVLEALALDPSLRSIYEYIVNNYGDRENKISKFAKTLYINIDEWKVTRLKEELQKNKVANLYDEEKILTAISNVKAECEYWGISHEEYTKKLDELWTKTNELLCNVDGKQFETRQEAECAKEDLEYLMEYSLKNNILGKDIEELAGEIKSNIKSDYYKENLQEKLKEIQEEQDLRNLQFATERIISRMQVYAKIKDKFDYGHIFSHKVAYEKLKDLVVDNQKVSFLFVTSFFKTGKSALLLTNTHLYSLKNEETKAIELSEFEGIGIQDEKVFIKYGGEEYDTGHEILNLSQNEYYFLFETIERVIKMCLSIKNKDILLEDEEVYNNIIIRSKNMEFIRHNKLKVFIIGGVLLLIIIYILNGITITPKPIEQSPVEIEEDVKEDLESNNDKVTQQLTSQAETDVKEEVSVNYDEAVLPVTENSSYGQSIFDFINNKVLCWYDNEGNTYFFNDILNNLEAELGMSDIKSYTFVNMDGRGFQEVVLELSGRLDDYYIIINYCEEIDKTIVITQNIRGFRDLTSQGVYMGSNGADSWCYCVLDFADPNNVTEEIIASTENGYYEVYGEAVTEDVFNQFCQEIYASDSAVWYSYTEEDFASDLGISEEFIGAVEENSDVQEEFATESIYIPVEIFKDEVFIEYDQIAGLYYGIGENYASINMYSAFDTEFVGNIEITGERTLWGELITLDTNLYQIITESGEEVLLGIYLDNGTTAGNLYINGQNAGYFMMVEQYAPPQ